MDSFKIRFLDHVAIRVLDMDRSVQWYERVLGLKACSLPQWNNYPVLMLTGKTGVAIFPAKAHGSGIERAGGIIKIDHFAFNVSKDDFEKARKQFENIGQEYTFQDHFYFHSIYVKDPDGHTVELTTLLENEDEFYK